jgi:hypothetical protein
MKIHSFETNIRKHDNIVFSSQRLFETGKFNIINQWQCEYEILNNVKYNLCQCIGSANNNMLRW